MDVKNLYLRALVLITTQKKSEKASELYKKCGVPVQYRLNAEGTASSEIMDMLGLGTIEKRVLITLLPKVTADKMLENLNGELKMNTVNSGIAFTFPLNGANGMILKPFADTQCDVSPEQDKEENSLGKKGEESCMSDKKYVMIASVVNRGYSEDVMKAARSEGARGGTVLHTLGSGNGEAGSFFGLNIQEEKDVVLILSDADSKLKIMNAINEKCGLQSDAEGLVVSMPIDSVMGI